MMPATTDLKRLPPDFTQRHYLERGELHPLSAEKEASFFFQNNWPVSWNLSQFTSKPEYCYPAKT